jgi:hypothetical protein
VGRAAGIGAAVVAGIISLPALLGSDRPPPVPPDVGLAPPPAEPVQAAVPPPPAPPIRAPKRPGRGDHRLATRKRPRERSRPRRKRSERRDGSHRRSGPAQRDTAETAAAPAPPIYVPPVYPYVPPPSSGEFQFER